jgi:hypothetical protein
MPGGGEVPASAQPHRVHPHSPTRGPWTLTTSRTSPRRRRITRHTTLSITPDALCSFAPNVTAIRLNPPTNHTHGAEAAYDDFSRLVPFICQLIYLPQTVFNRRARGAGAAAAGEIAPDQT